jgi:hypothetical protein
LNDPGRSDRPDWVEARDADSCKPTLGVKATPEVAALMAGDGPGPRGSKMSRRLKAEEASRRDIKSWAHCELKGIGPRSRPIGLWVTRNLGSQEFQPIKVPRVRARVGGPSECPLERRNPLICYDILTFQSRTFLVAPIAPIDIRR